ncbi:Mur ligase family protein [Candidatus Gottesmanbacteria bacterium]|nr:Mur ligase family protein [Candidatus Gottesmanbacteria bacterium]
MSTVLHLGAGATWPGEIALRVNHGIFAFFVSQFRKEIILVAGTNGKTTTSLMITQVLEKHGFSVVHNSSGANLLNGVVSACIQRSSWNGTLRADYGVFEVDENSLPVVISIIKHKESVKGFTLVLLNLFRDQLDRYGEVDVIAEKWEKSLREQRAQHKKKSNSRNKKIIQIIANADDPLIAHLASIASISTPDIKAFYFGLNDRALFQQRMDHATDSIFCPSCGSRLAYEGMYYSHIGVWHCLSCGAKRPVPDIDAWQSPLPGLYNQYNTLAAVAALRSVGVSDSHIQNALTDFAPAFGRQEEFLMDGKRLKLFLSKNPAGFNASLQTVLNMKPITLLLVLNDRIPDGRDVSWIWDVDFEVLGNKKIEIIVSGDRAYDLAVRIKYAIQFQNFTVETDLKKAISHVLQTVKNGETVYILATYSAMLAVRKVITGKKIV